MSVGVGNCTGFVKQSCKVCPVGAQRGELDKLYSPGIEMRNRHASGYNSCFVPRLGKSLPKNQCPRKMTGPEQMGDNYRGFDHLRVSSLTGSPSTRQFCASMFRQNNRSRFMRNGAAPLNAQPLAFAMRTRIIPI